MSLHESSSSNGFKTYLFPVASSITTPVFMSKTKTGAFFLSAFPVTADDGSTGGNLFGWFRTLLTGFLLLLLGLLLFLLTSVITIGLYTTAL